MSRKVCIKSGSRLHFGVLSYHPDSSSHFGGVGVMIDDPGFQMELEAESLSSPISIQEFIANLRIDSEEEYGHRIRSMVELYLEKMGIRNPDQNVSIRLKASAPSHEGFGSGTQLGMSISQALSFLFKEDNQPGREILAGRVGRGARSSLGIHGFIQGGFLVDGGKKDPDSLGVLVARHDFPTEWRWVIARSTNQKGISGKSELDAFSRLEPMPEVISHQLCRIALMELLPSVISEDYEHFSESLYQFGSQVGDFFSPVQGGRFACSTLSDWIECMRTEGVKGIAQSSWGPACAAICSSQSMAEELVQNCSRDSRWKDISFQVASPLNHGAVIEFE